ncbi:AAA family ATPase [Empedobacter brevis]
MDLNLENHLKVIKIAPKSLYKTMNAKEWIEIGKSLPEVKPLFGNIWNENEVAILFGETGSGKSLFSVQLADAISKGNIILGLPTTKKKVLYFDFEISTKSFFKRYSDKYGNVYQFNENFLRAEIDLSNESIDKFTDAEGIIKTIKKEIEFHKPEVVIIDNISYISSNNERSKDALEFMKFILSISRLNNIAVLLLAHRPKNPTFNSFLTIDSLAGSKALANFTDVCFGIGRSAIYDSLVYIKELKNRNFPIVYNTDNVIVCSVEFKNSMLQFVFKNLDSEESHIILQKEEDDEINTQILKFKNEGLSNVEIGTKLGVSEGAIRKRLKKLQS